MIQKTLIRALFVTVEWHRYAKEQYMGVMVTIRYTSEVADNEATTLAHAMRARVVEVTEEQDVFVYADKALVAVSADPIEVFMQVNAHKVSDIAGLMDKITNKLANWKRQNDFALSINLNITPVEWHAEFGI
jgi:hypothetical protein